MTDKDAFEKLVEKLGLKRASELSRLGKKEEAHPSHENIPIPTSPSETTNITETSSLIQKLRERLGIFTEPSIPKTSRPTSSGSSFLEGGTLIGSEASQCLYFSEIYSHPYSYGKVILADALHFSAHEARITSAGVEIPEFSAEKALFIDTETTSCFGGTGTVAFLVGIGYFTGTDFYVEQFFMRDYDDEPALLEALDERIQRASLFIGYNSKCFDLPLLRNRYRMNRLPFHGEELSHFDLMHVARRFWNRRLSDCSLNTVERFILGVKRYGDIPGAVIPRLWLNYIETGNAEAIPRILEHNRRDILALAGLMAWIALRIQVPKGLGFEELTDRFSLLRLQMKCAHYSDAIETAEELLQQSDYLPLRAECWKMLSEAYRKLQLWDEREKTLILWANEDTTAVFPRIELAKWYEHQLKQIEPALYWTEQALEIEPYNPLIMKRKERLLRKLQTMSSPPDTDISIPDLNYKEEIE